MKPHHASTSHPSHPGPTYGVGKALPQRTGSHLHSAGHSELWVSRRAAACMAMVDIILAYPGDPWYPSNM